jgi:TonB family protein
MHISRAGALFFRCCSLLLSLCVLTHVVCARPSQQGGGDQRDEVRARLLAVGERPKDAEAWFNLGIAYNRVGDAGEARKAFQQALKLRSGHVPARVGLAYTYFVEKNYADAENEAKRAADQSINSHDYTAHSVLNIIRLQRYRDTATRVLARAESELAKKPDAAEWYLLKAQAVIGLSAGGEQTIPPDLTFPPYSPPPPETMPDEATRKALREAARAKLREAAASLEKYFALKPSDGDSYWRGQLEALRAYTRDEDAAGTERIFAQSQVTSKAVITGKPEPGYTKAARESGLSGLIRLRVVLAADGTVKHVLVLLPLGHGLSESAVKAARGIKFRPATLNGRPVSQYAILEYNFNVY